MQHSLAIEPLPQFAAHQSNNFDSQPSSSGQPAQPLCGAFDALTCCLLLGCSSGTVSCIHLGRYGSTARRVLGRHAGRVTAACLFPWQAPEHIAAAATVVPCARVASFFATCSADASIKIWTSDAKALHTTDACLQTLRGHRAAVTSLASVQVDHTWCLLSGGADGQLLLWRSESPDSGDQQLSGAAMLAQLVPHMRLTEAPQFTSPHWILGIACPLQQTEAGLDQGAFVALAQQPLQQVPISRSAVADTCAGIAASAAVTAAQQQQQQQQQPISSPSSTKLQLQRGQQQAMGFDAASAVPAQHTSRLGRTALAGVSSVQGFQQQPGLNLNHKAGISPATHTAAQQGQSCQTAGPASSPTRTACMNATRTVQHKLPQPDRASSIGSFSGDGSSSLHSSSFWSSALSLPTSVREIPSTQRLSILAVKYVPQQMAVITLAYDGACRLHALAEGVVRCCWHSPTGSNYVAADVCTGVQGQIVLLGDDTGCLHLYSLANDKLLATKQVSSSRISGIISCDSPGSSGSSMCGSPPGSSSSSSSRGGTCVQFAVLSEDGAGLWQLRQGFSHGVVPGGHRQGVLVLQYCSSPQQMGKPEALHQPATLGKCQSFSATSSNKQDLSTSSIPSYSRSASTSSHGIPGSSSAGGCNSGSSGSGSGSSSQLTDSSHGDMLMSIGLDGRVIQWSVADGCPSAVQSLLATAGAESGSELTAMAYLQGSSITATGHDNGQILLWHMDTGPHSVLGPQAHTNSVSCLAAAYTAKGDEQLVSGGFDGWVCLWEPRQVRGIKPHMIARFQAYGCRPSSPKALQTQEQQQCKTAPLSAASASTSSSSAASGRRTPGSRATSQQGGRLIDAAAERDLPTRQGSPLSSATASAAVKSTPGSAQHSLSGRQQQVQTPGPVGIGSGKPQSAASQKIGSSRGGSGGSSGVDVLAAMHVSPPEVLAVLFEPVNQVIITAGNDGSIKVWAGGASGLLLGQHLGHTGPVNCLVTDGNLLFSGSQDSTIRMWDVLPPWFKGQGAASRPLSGLDASCRAPGSTGVHAPSSTAFAVFHAHSAVTGLAVAADSAVLVSCGADGQVLQWDYSTGQLLGRYSLEGQRLSCVAVEPSGLQVFVGTAQGQLLTVPGMDQMCGGEAAAAAAAQKLQAVLSL